MVVLLVAPSSSFHPGFQPVGLWLLPAVVLAALITFSAVRDFQRLPGLLVIAWVGGISYGLHLLHNPIQLLAVRLAVPLTLPESTAALLLVALPILAAVAYFQTIEAWSLRLMQRVMAPAPLGVLLNYLPSAYALEGSSRALRETLGRTLYWVW